MEGYSRGHGGEGQQNHSQSQREQPLLGSHSGEAVEGNEKKKVLTSLHDIIRYSMLKTGKRGVFSNVLPAVK